MPDITLADPRSRTIHPRPHFVGWGRDVLRKAAALLAEQYASGVELRMDHVTVVLPGARATRQLKEHLLIEVESRRLRLIPPRITTVGALPELLYQPGRPTASDALSRSIWRQALRDLPSDRLELLYTAPPAADDLLAWNRLARNVMTLHQEVSGGALRFEDVARRTASGLLFADTDRWSVLAELQTEYAGKLAALGYSDRALARIEALSQRAAALNHDLWLVGVIELQRVAWQLVASARGAAQHLKMIVQAPPEEASSFDELGCVRTEAWASRPIPVRDAQFAVREGPADQAREATRFLASLDGRYAAEEILVATPDETLVPYLEQTLGDAGVKTHAAAGTPIERSPVLRLLSGIADFIDGRRFEAGAALVRHPDLAAWISRFSREAGSNGGHVDASWLDELDLYFNTHLPAHLRPVGKSNPAATRSAIAGLLDALDRSTFLGRLSGTRPLAQWMPEITGLLVDIYGGQELDLSRPANRRIVEASQRVRSAALELMHLPQALAESTNAATAIRLLIDELADVSLAPDPDRDAVELLGWLELRTDEAPVAVVTSFNEPALPESVNAHPFLPNSLRERLGLVCNARRYARDAYELTALLHSREKLHMIAGRRSSTNDPLRPSRLALAVEGDALARRVELFYAAGDTAPDDGVPPTRTSEGEAPPPVGFPIPPEPVIRAPQPIQRLRVTDFRTLLRDPYQFALERIHRLDALDDTARELDGLGFGSLAHHVLEQFARTEMLHSTSEVEIRKQLDELLDTAARIQFGADVLPAVRIQVEQLRARLHAFATWHAGWIGEGWQVVGVECSPPPEGVPFQVDGEPIYLSGRVDRVDYHPDQRRIAVFDYKTGDAGDAPDRTHRAGPQNDRRWVDLQLPLYRHLLPHLKELDLAALSFDGSDEALLLGYITLPRNLAQTGAQLAGWSAEELEEADECARDVVRMLRENEFRFNPDTIGGYRFSPLGDLLGLGYLESAAAGEEGES